MQRFRLPFGLRAVPARRSIVVEHRRASLDFFYSLGWAANYIFNVDIYAYNNHAHPDRHLGWWHFGLPGRSGRGTLAMAFDPIRPASVRLEVDGEDVPAVSCWTNPDFRFDPLGDIELVMRGPNGEIARLERALLKFVDRDILVAFYGRQYAVDGYASPAVAPFLPELHQYKLRRLQRLFERHVPGGRVLDVGCGQSLFTEMQASFPFHVYSGDLNLGWVRSRARKFPHQTWAVFDADAVPFRDGEFDALFAGEIIEHVTDGTAHPPRMVARPEAGRGGRNHNAQPGATGRTGGRIGESVQPRSSQRAVLPRPHSGPAARVRLRVRRAGLPVSRVAPAEPVQPSTGDGLPAARRQPGRVRPHDAPDVPARPLRALGGDGADCRRPQASRRSALTNIAALPNLHAVEHHAQLALVRDAEHVQRNPGDGLEPQFGGRFARGDGLREFRRDGDGVPRKPSSGTVIEPSG